VGRVDHALSSRDRLTVRYFVDRFAQEAELYLRNLLTYSDSAMIVSRNALVQAQHIFGRGLVNDMHFSYSSVMANRAPPPGAPSMSAPGVNMFDAGLSSIQSIAVRNFFTAGDDPPAQFDRSSYRWSDDLSWIRGRHSLSLGASIDRSLVDVRNQTNKPGAFTFTADVTKYAPAAFLLGQLDQFVQGSGLILLEPQQLHRRVFPGRCACERAIDANRASVTNRSFRGSRKRGVMQFRAAAYQKGMTSRVFTNAPPGMLYPGDPGVPSAGYTGDW